MDKIDKMFVGIKPSERGKFTTDPKERCRLDTNYLYKHENGNLGVIQVERIVEYIKESKEYYKKLKASGKVYADGPYKGLPIIEDNPTWLAELFMFTVFQSDIRAIRNDVAINASADESGELSDEDVAYFENRIKNIDSYRPEIVVPPNKMPMLNAALDNFLHKNYQENLEYTIGKDAGYFFHWLIKNMTNSDTSDLISYIKRYTDFTTDKTFSKLSEAVVIGRIEDITFYALNADEYEAGLETPYLMLFWAENPQNSSVLPFIRYGIEETEKGKTAYIYAAQRRRDKNAFDTELDKKLTRIFAGANSGVKENRNITPSMVCMLATFIGMLQSKGVKEVKIPDFVIRRWGNFWQAKTDEDCERIQSNATNKFLLSFIRLADQFNGLDVSFVPNEIDSYLHLTLADELSSNNKTLAKFYDMGKNEGTSADYVEIPERLQKPSEEFQNQ